MTEKELTEKIIKNKDKYFLWVSRPASIQRLTFLIRAFYRCIGTNTINFQGNKGDLSYYFERDKYKKAGMAFAASLNSEKAVAEHLLDYKKYSRELLAVGIKAKNLATDRSELLDIFPEYQKALDNFVFYLLTPFWVDDYIFPSLAERLKKTIAPGKYQAALEIISSPTTVFGYQKYHLTLARAKSKQDYRSLIENYRWVKEYSFQERLLDQELAIADRRQLAIGGLIDTAVKVPKVCQNNKRRLGKLLKRIKDKNLKTQIRLVNDYINIKTERIEVYKMFQADFRCFFYRLLELVKKKQKTACYENIISMTDEEILDFLRYGQKVNLVITKKRLALDFVSFGARGKMFFIYNHNLIKKIKKIFTSVLEDKRIKGVVVSKGIVTGHVRLIYSSKDLKKVRPREILVANFTTPEYAPAIKKAGGIITDDGGITSHAAIVARELKKPCVVGTKIATQVLKDGDLVEVDAEKGVVRIIN